MNRGCIVAVILLWMPYTGKSQVRETQNIILITLDGLRWQEVFQGADPSIAHRKKYVRNPEEVSKYWYPEGDGRRKLLMPFLWGQVALDGQLYGNRDLGNKVDCTNHRLISYPGYSEMLVGFKNKKIRSNRKIENPHPTVLEVIENNHRFKDEVAAFTTWDAFPYILRTSKSGIYLNAGKDRATGKLSADEQRLNQLQENGEARSDSMTFHYAMEYLKRERPRVTFIALDETDHYAHLGRYDEYLNAANRADQVISQLWKWLQSQPDYKDQTTLFITTDHGRGKGKNNWRKHRSLAKGSGHIWFAVIGPDTPAFGEMRTESQSYQKQVAQTIAAFLGLPYSNHEPVGEIVQTMISNLQGNIEAERALGIRKEIR